MARTERLVEQEGYYGELECRLCLFGERQSEAVAGEALHSATEALPQSQAGAEISVLCLV